MENSEAGAISGATILPWWRSRVIGRPRLKECATRESGCGPKLAMGRKVTSPLEGVSNLAG